MNTIVIFKICGNHFKIITKRLLPQKDAGRNAISVDPDQTAPIRAVSSGSALMALTYLQKKLRIITVLSEQHHRKTINVA